MSKILDKIGFFIFMLTLFSGVPLSAFLIANAFNEHDKIALFFGIILLIITVSIFGFVRGINQYFTGEVVQFERIKEGVYKLFGRIENITILKKVADDGTEKYFSIIDFPDNSMEQGVVFRRTKKDLVVI
ncbi:MAG: hypothetical protein HGA36_02475 [Candidatus Moranbacteria bacterium]|nr:hypothetical protein [Candidatus Moranbacteria bacterium]